MLIEVPRARGVRKRAWRGVRTRAVTRRGVRGAAARRGAQLRRATRAHAYAYIGLHSCACI